LRRNSGHVKYGFLIGAVETELIGKNVKVENLINFVPDKAKLIALTLGSLSRILVKSEVNLIIHNDVLVFDDFAGENVHVVHDTGTVLGELFCELYG
jgi:hypothetical protein